jgi:hypothetical protein
MWQDNFLELYNMKNQIPAQIYKSDVRGVLGSENYECFSTFNFDLYQDWSRKPFGSLQVLNDETLAPQNEVTTILKENTDSIILPLFGGIEYKDSLGNVEFIGVENFRLISAEKEMSFKLFNPYKNENVSYLQIWFDNNEQNVGTVSQQTNFNFSRRNGLIPLFEISKALGFIGIYDGREEGFYTLRNHLNGVFVFVIHGVFEVENRLLESRDGLSIKKSNTIEWEALSENAVLLVFEISLNEN